MTTTTAETKIVIVAGQEFSVPAATDNEAIRGQLTSMGFADVASAEIKLGTKKVGEETYQTVEFIKKAGTKGLGGAELARLMEQIPIARLPAAPLSGPDRAQAALLRSVMEGGLTIDAALDMGTTLDAALDACQPSFSTPSTEGAQLCSRLDTLPAVAAPAAPSGW
jgi:hypothetical protein